MATANTFDQYSADLHNAIHNFSSHEFKAFLTNEQPLATDTVKADITEIAGGNGYTSGGVVVPVIGSSQTGGGYAVQLDDTVDPTITPTGAIPTFQFIVIYNNTAANKNLVQWYELPAPVTLSFVEPVTPFVFDFGTTLRTA